MRELKYHERQAHGKEEKDIVEPPAHVPLVEQLWDHLQKRARKKSAAAGQSLDEDGINGVIRLERGEAAGKPEKETGEKRVVPTKKLKMICGRLLRSGEICQQKDTRYRSEHVESAKHAAFTIVCSLCGQGPSLYLQEETQERLHGAAPS